MKPVFAKPNFGKPPPGYIPGLGRGAVGFITRSDLGPARAADTQQSDTSYLRAFGATGEAKERDLSQTVYDKWNGYGESLFANAPNEADDKEADREYRKVEKYMNGRREKQREVNMRAALDQIRKDRPGIASQFKDIKGELGSVSMAEWANLPPANNIVGKGRHKKKEYDRFTPVPDTIIEQALMDKEVKSSIDPNAQFTQPGAIVGQTRKAEGNETVLTDLIQQRGKKLVERLDTAGFVTESSGFVTPAVNREGYISELDSQKISSYTEIHDLKKARLLMKALREQVTDNYHGWLGGARVEEMDGKIGAARAILEEACNRFPTSETIFLEASRLAVSAKMSRRILEKGINNNSRSVKLWQARIDKEESDEKKKEILKVAIEACPQSLELWKQVVEMQTDQEEASKLLHKAVVCVPAPHSKDLWLALAKLQSYEKAKDVLNKARAALPTEPVIWITAVMLEEAQGKVKDIDTFLGKAVTYLTKKEGLVIKKEQWLNQAQKAEKGGSVLTAQGIIKVVFEKEKELREEEMLHFATECLNLGAIECSRQLLRTSMKLFPKHIPTWKYAIQIEKDYGSQETHLNLLNLASTELPEVPQFCLSLSQFYAEEQQNESKAEQVLQQALERQPQNETILLALVQFYCKKKHFSEAQALLTNGRDKLNTERIWMYSVQILREQREHTRALSLLEEALKRFGQFWKLWLIKAHILVQQGEASYALISGVYEEGLKRCKEIPEVWIDYARYLVKLEEKGEQAQGQSYLTRARTILYKARGVLNKCEKIWLASAKLEEDAGNEKIAANLLNKGRHECEEQTGQLIANQLRMMKSAGDKKTRVKNLDDTMQENPFIRAELAKVAWEEHKLDKAKRYMNLVVSATDEGKQNGDFWALLYKLEQEEKKEEEEEEFKIRINKTKIRRGAVWCAVAKQIDNWEKSNYEIVKIVADMLN